MRLRRDRLVMRWVGSLVGAGFCALGVFAIVGSRGAVGAVARDRALWYGITVLVIGVIAVVSSWVVRNPGEIWCRYPRRWGRG